MLVSAADVRALIPGLRGTDEDATLIEPLIRRVDELFARRCWYPEAAPGVAPTMESRTYALALTGDTGRELDLGVYPVTSITSAKKDDTGNFEGSESTIAVADIVIRDGRRARLLSTSSSSWSTAKGGNLLLVVAGYNGSSTVNGAHNASVTTITVASTAGFAVDRNGGGRVVVGSEVILFAAKTATTLTGCTRGAEGTTAATISNGATITQPTPDALKHLVAQAVRHLFDLRQTQGTASNTTQGSAITVLDDTPGSRDNLPGWILAGLAPYVLPRGMLGRGYA